MRLCAICGKPILSGKAYTCAVGSCRQERRRALRRVYMRDYYNRNFKAVKA